MRAITQSRRWPGNEAIGTNVIYSESEEAAASSASMLGTPMESSIWLCPCVRAYVRDGNGSRTRALPETGAARARSWMYFDLLPIMRNCYFQTCYYWLLFIFSIAYFLFTYNITRWWIIATLLLMSFNTHVYVLSLVCYNAIVYMYVHMLICHCANEIA